MTDSDGRWEYRNDGWYFIGGPTTIGPYDKPRPIPVKRSGGQLAGLGALVLKSDHRLCIYDTAGKRRYWLPISALKIGPAKDGKINIENIPNLVCDESFTIGELGIEDANGNVLMTFQFNTTSKAMTTGCTLQIDSLTVAID